MKHFFKCSIVVLLFLFTASAFAGYTPRGVELIKTSDGYKVNFSLGNYEISKSDVKGERFLRLVVPEYGVSNQPGKPDLPQISFFLLINSSDLKPGFKLTGSVPENKMLDAKIYPAQAPWEKTKSFDERPFTIDRGYYSGKGSIDNDLVTISEPFVIAGAKGVLVTITPFAYNPSENKLVVTSNASFDIKLSGSPDLSFAPGQAYNEFYNKLFVNYSQKKSVGTNNYLIITAPEYESTMSLFVSHKSGLGYNVFMVNTSVTGTSNSAIKTYIQNRYNNLSTRPEFILLVGDVDKIPDWIGTGEGTPHTDLNYSLLEGSDSYADAFIGRFPATNTAQISNMISKTIYMENNINSLPKKSIFMASTDNYAITEATHNMCIDSFFLPSGYTFQKLYTQTYGATTTQLITALNANQSFAIYSGHGSETSWADGPPLNQSQVNSLTNTVFPYVYSFACVTGSFHLSTECFSETWVRIPAAGSVFWGSSVNSYWDEDDILQRRIFRGMFVEGMKRTSPSFVFGKYMLVQHYGSVTPTMQRYLEMYNCMGDPAIYMTEYGPSITHTQLPNTENLAGPYPVNCVVNPSGSAITGAKVFWTRGTSFNDSINMTNTSGNNWAASIPGNGTQAIYRYYLKAQDAMGRVVKLPGNAPANFFEFVATSDTTKPQIVHSPIPTTPKQYWPISVSASVTDLIGIDSVWVRWYKNTPANTRTFKLLNSTGSIYSAVFNSLNNDVIPGDTIFYRIIAQDNAFMHNRDSSALYRFGISNIVMNNLVRKRYMPIRDNQTTTDSIYVATNAMVIYTAFSMDTLIHTYDGDLMLSLISPAGTEVILSNRRGSSGDNFIQTRFNDSASIPIASGTAPFSSQFKPDGNLISFNGQNAQGWWKFKVQDMAGSDTGRVSSYTLIIYSGDYLTNTGNQTNVPTQYSLAQNYPNPFNPVTKIAYSVPKNAYVNLKIYDILGREIATLVNSVVTAGNYTVDFDASRLSSGVYFYRLESGDFVDVKRMILLK